MVQIKRKGGKSSMNMIRIIGRFSILSLLFMISVLFKVPTSSSKATSRDEMGTAGGEVLEDKIEAALKPAATNNMTKRAESSSNSSNTSKKPSKCTLDQKLKIRSQLIPELCVSSHLSKKLYRQLCSITTATKCPKATWLDEYYVERQAKLAEQSSSAISSSFLGISIGCNKGFDAISTLRMGTYDREINKPDWKKAMTADGEELHQSVCGQDEEDESGLNSAAIATAAAASNKSLNMAGEMHCVEPMPQTFHKLKQSAEDLHYNDKGLIVTHAAVSKESGKMLFHTSGGHKSGVENKGLATCMKMSSQQREKECETVPVYSLNEFVHQKVQSTGPINILSIDVEGFDGDVLLGAGSEVLKRVEYLEFEYNWMGSWAKQHLYDIVEMLDENNMTCYWAGINRLWRITDCWMSYFDIHTWSNVACVNRSVESLASKMEGTFQRTLKDDKVWLREDKVNLYNDLKQNEKITAHKAMSINEEDMMNKYI